MRIISKTISAMIGQLRGNSLKARSARGVMTLGFGTVAGRGTRFVRNMILARILAPDEFGLMAIIIVASMALEAFTEVGVKQSVIQNKSGADPVYLNVAWWMQALRGLGLFVIASLVAPWISSFYDKPELLKLLQVSFLAILFRGLFSPRAHVLEKELRFVRVVFLIQGSAMLGAMITIGLAFTIRNVWALVIGSVAETAILCLLSHILVPFLPRFRIDKNCLGELMKFARGMFGLPIFLVVAFQMDVIVLAKIVTKEQLGTYSLAVHLAYLPIVLFDRTIRPVLLPALAQKQDHKDSLCRALLWTTRGAAALSMPLIAFMATCAGGILLLAYGPKYVAAAVPFSILAVFVFIRIQSGFFVQTYLALGKPHLHRRFMALRASITACLMYPAIAIFDLPGAAGVILLANIITLYFELIVMGKVIGLRFLEYVRSWLPGMLGCSVVLGSVISLRLFGVQSALGNVIVVGLSCIPGCALALLSLKSEMQTTYERQRNIEKLGYLSSK